jgi:hypothetical protein
MLALGGLVKTDVFLALVISKNTSKTNSFELT